MSVKTYSAVGQRTTVHAAIKFLEHALPVVILEKFASVKPMPKNKAETVTFRRLVPLNISTTELTEGVTPAATDFSYEDVSATIKQYGDWMRFTDKVRDLSEDPVLNDMMELQGEQAQETREQLLWNTIKAGTNVFYATGATSRATVNAPIDRPKQRAITRALKQQKARKVNKMLAASVKISTEAIEASYICVAHTDLEADIRDMAGFINVKDYGSSSAISEYEIGAVEDVRYILSPSLGAFENAGSGTLNGMISSDGSNVNVYPAIYFGMNAFGCVALKGADSVEIRVQNPGAVLTESDPIAQRGFCSWKTYFTTLILNEAWIARLEVGATDL